MKLLKTVNTGNVLAIQEDGSENGIMIVDDSKFSRNILKDILIKEGFNVIAEAKNGLEAVEMTAQKRPKFIFMDVEMPILDGLGAIPRILEVDPGVHIIMCTAMGQKNIIVEAARAGAKDYILKPYKRENIVRVLSTFAEVGHKTGQVIPFQSGKKYQDGVQDIDANMPEPPEAEEEDMIEETETIEAAKAEAEKTIAKAADDIEEVADKEDIQNEIAENKAASEESKEAIAAEKAAAAIEEMEAEEETTGESISEKIVEKEKVKDTTADTADIEASVGVALKEEMTTTEETSEKGTDGKETAEKETVEKETVEKETVEKETAVVQEDIFQDTLLEPLGLLDTTEPIPEDAYLFQPDFPAGHTAGGTPDTPATSVPSDTCAMPLTAKAESSPISTAGENELTSEDVLASDNAADSDDAADHNEKTFDDMEEKISLTREEENHTDSVAVENHTVSVFVEEYPNSVSGADQQEETTCEDTAKDFAPAHEGENPESMVSEKAVENHESMIQEEAIESLESMASEKAVENHESMISEEAIERTESMISEEAIENSESMIKEAVENPESMIQKEAIKDPVSIEEDNMKEAVQEEDTEASVPIMQEPYSYLWENRFEALTSEHFIGFREARRIPVQYILHRNDAGYILQQKSRSEKELLTGMVKAYLNHDSRLQQGAENSVKTGAHVQGIRILTDPILAEASLETMEMTMDDILKLPETEDKYTGTVILQKNNLTNALSQLVSGKTARKLALH